MRTSLAGIRSKFSAVEQVGTEALLVKLRESEVVLVDVRRRDEFEVSHLPGAIHVDMASSDEAFLRALPEDRDVIVYCSIGYRSAVVAERMRVAGRANVSNYLGSIFAWANAGHPLERAGGQAAATVHPYDAAWGALLEPSRRYPID